MSRIGKNPITLPAGVEVKVADGAITVKGPLGTLTAAAHPPSRSASKVRASP